MEDEWPITAEPNQATRRLAARLVEAGWHRSGDNKISHPTRPELNVAWNAPPFDNFMLSPRLAELLMEHKKPWIKILLDALSE